MKYVLTYVTATGEIRGGYSSGKPGLSQPDDPALTNVIVRGSVYDQAFEKIEGFGNRYTYSGGNLVERTDNRPITRWIADPGGVDEASTADGPVEYVLDMGDPAGTVRVEVVDAQGNVRTNVTATRRLELAGKRVKVSVVNGVATINVPTGQPREVEVRSNPDFKLDNPIKVIVTDTEL